MADDKKKSVWGNKGEGKRPFQRKSPSEDGRSGSSFGGDRKRSYGERGESKFGNRDKEGDDFRREGGRRPLGGGRVSSSRDKQHEGFDRDRGGFNRDRGGFARDRDNRGGRPDWLKRLVGLRSERGRERENLFLAEGVNCVRELLEHSPDVIRQVHMQEDFSNPELEKALKKKEIRTKTMEERDFEQVATTVNAQGIIAECMCSSIRPHWESAHLVTLVDGVQDPGNLGALFRTSLAFGMDALVLGKGTADPFNPKVVRGSSGMFMRLPFETRMDISEKIAYLRSQGFTILGTSSHAKKDVSQVKLRKKVALLMGNEGAGADNQLLALTDEQVRIPMASGIESLNVAVAHGILASQLFSLRG